MSKLGSNWEDWFDKNMPELNQEERIKTKKWITNILLIISIPLLLWALIDFGIEVFSEPNIEAESQDIVWTPEFVNFNDCRVDEVCWNRVFDSFLDAINEDSKDGYFDCDDWLYGCSEYSYIGFVDIQDGLAKIANTELKQRVILNFDKNLLAIEENPRTAIIEKINYQWDYLKRIILNGLD